MIVLNGQPFLRYCLRALYPFAHEIIIVEGASPHAVAIATPEGHSTDGTLAAVRRFEAEEDPEGKVSLVTAEDEGYPDGFWPGEKTEQSQAYARRATGDWLWQVDVDEFYLAEDMAWICSALLTRSDVWAVSFKHLLFWGNPTCRVDGWYLRHGYKESHRVFRWGPGFSYVAHRPPTVVDGQGVNLRKRGWIRPHFLAKRDIFLYHYAFLFPAQVEAKCQYYAAVDWARFQNMNRWAEDTYANLSNPYRVHNYPGFPSWLQAHPGRHPAQVQVLWDDVRNGRLEEPMTLRRTDDIERLLASRRYRWGALLLKVTGRPGWAIWTLPSSVYMMLPKTVRRHLKGRLLRSEGERDSKIPQEGARRA